MAALDLEPEHDQNHGISQPSGNSQTAQEFIDSQLLMEAEAREALPYVSPRNRILLDLPD